MKFEKPYWFDFAMIEVAVAVVVVVIVVEIAAAELAEPVAAAAAVEPVAAAVGLAGLVELAGPVELAAVAVELVERAELVLVALSELLVVRQPHFVGPVQLVVVIELSFEPGAPIDLELGLPDL